MNWAVPAVAWIGAVVTLVAGRLLFGKLRGLSLARANPGRKVSVIIPARDEERNLRKLLPALAGQSMPPHEIIVVDDQSSDGTAAIARAAGAKLIEGRDLPEGWFGKPWACHQGAEAASGEWLWFLDADVEPETEALERLSGLMTPDSVISVCPWHRTEQLYEQLSVFFNLLMVGGIGASTWRGDAAPGIGLFGQCLLIPRPVYDAVGGHAAVRQTVLENFHLSRLLEKEGVRKVSRIGRGSISMRMFPDGYEQLRESWVKGFASGAGLTSKPALVLCSIWLSGLMTLLVSTLLMPLADPVSRALTGLAFFAGGLGLVRLFRQVGGFAWWSALAFPLALVFYLQVFVKSVRRRHGGQKTQWKGRDVA